MARTTRSAAADRGSDLRRPARLASGGILPWTRPAEESGDAEGLWSRAALLLLGAVCFVVVIVVDGPRGPAQCPPRPGRPARRPPARPLPRRHAHGVVPRCAPHRRPRRGLHLHQPFHVRDAAGGTGVHLLSGDRAPRAPSLAPDAGLLGARSRGTLPRSSRRSRSPDRRRGRCVRRRAIGSLQLPGFPWRWAGHRRCRITATGPSSP